jgi:mannose-6-phosphate isomerase-like protein (cupin superfamily)
MSYPQPRYLGEGGERTATYRPADQKPELSLSSGDTVRYLATGATTHGQFGLYRWEMGPQPGGPSPHFHRSISESFYVLSGVISIYDGRRWVDSRPGDFVHVPEGGIHGYRNESGEPASMLLLFSPGAPREDYFERVGEVASMSDEDRAAFMLHHDSFWVDG